MTDSHAEAAFAAWCDSPRIKRDRMRRRQQWAAFVAGWIEGQGPRPAAPAPAAAPVLEGQAAFRRCDTGLTDVGGECLACDAIQGEACRLPESRTKIPGQIPGPVIANGLTL